MKTEKNRTTLITILTSLLVILIYAGVHFYLLSRDTSRSLIRVGFVYDGDESTPYTANFMRAQRAMEKTLGSKVEVYAMTNTHEGQGVEDAIQKLVEKDCDIIFTTSYGYGEVAKQYAMQYPQIQFCEATCDNADDEPFCENYHTFMGEIYQGRYIAGVLAGMKMQEMIDRGVITPAQAKVGYVGAYPYAEVISGYTAFFLGIRSVVPEAVMEVKYTNAWSNFKLEKRYAEDLIDRGCVIISQHSDTLGPAVACEAVRGSREVYHIGYNQSMIDVAPTTSIISTRINWEPYILGACEAVLANRRIEDCIKGNVHGNDIGAGFERDWVQMLELNSIIAAEGSEERIEHLINEFESSDVNVFYGDYTGVNPYDETDTIDLHTAYHENETSSAPSFGYVLSDVITIVE